MIAHWVNKAHGGDSKEIAHLIWPKTELLRGHKIFSRKVWRLALKLLISMLFGKMNSEKVKENI